MKPENAVAETATNQHQEEDGTIIVPNAELQSIIVANKVADADGQRLQKEFSGVFAVIAEWETKNASLVIERADQSSEMALAADGAKKVAKARIAFTKAWKDVKQPYLQATQALDAINRFALAKFKPLEDALEAKSLVGARLLQAEKDLLIEQRKGMLREVGHSGDIPGLGEMHADTFQVFLDGAIAGAKRQKENDERLLAEQQDRERLTKLCADLLALGAYHVPEVNDNCYMLGNAEFSGYHDGISEADAARILEAFQQKAKDLKEWETKGRNRREALLKVGADEEWERLGGLCDTEWASVLEGHTNTYNEAKAAKEAEQVRKDRSAARILWLVRIGANETQWDQELGYSLDSSTVTLYQIDNHDDAEWQKVIADFTDSRKRLDDAAALEAKIKERTAERKLQITQLGATIEFSVPGGDEAVLGAYSISIIDLGNASDDDFVIILQGFKDEQKIIQRTAERKLQLLALGATHRVNAESGYEFGYELGTICASIDCVECAEEDDWTIKSGEFTKERDRLAQEEDDRKQAAAAKVKLGNDRRVELAALGEIKDSDVLAALSPDEWITLRDNAARLKKLADDQALKERVEAQQKEDADKLQAEQATAARQKAAADRKAAAAPDKEKLEKLAKTFADLAASEVNSGASIVLPTCTTDEGRAIIADVRTMLLRMHAHISSKAASM